MSKKLKTLLGISTLVFLLSLGAFGYIFFVTEQNISKIAELSRGVRDQDMRSRQAQKLVAILGHTTETQDALKEFVVGESDIVKVIETIESIGTRAGVTVTISSLTADDTGVLGKVKGRVETRGSWNSTLTYMNAIEQLPYKITTSNISLRRDQTTEKGKAPMWNMTFSIELLKTK